jgi:hypothetical protein
MHRPESDTAPPPACFLHSSQCTSHGWIEGVISCEMRYEPSSCCSCLKRSLSGGLGEETGRLAERGASHSSRGFLISMGRKCKCPSVGCYDRCMYLACRGIRYLVGVRCRKPAGVFLCCGRVADLRMACTVLPPFADGAATIYSGVGGLGRFFLRFQDRHVRPLRHPSMF